MGCAHGCSCVFLGVVNNNNNNNKRETGTSGQGSTTFHFARSLGIIGRMMPCLHGNVSKQMLSLHWSIYIYIYRMSIRQSSTLESTPCAHNTHTQRRITTHIIFPTRHKDSGLSIGTNSECNWLLGVVTTSREYILIIEYYSRYSNSTSIYFIDFTDPCSLGNPHIVYISMYILLYTAIPITIFCVP